MRIVTVCIMRVAVCGTGVPEIVTSFVGTSRSSTRSATISITGVGLIFFVSIRASAACRCCWWVQSCIQLKYLVEVEEFLLDDGSVQILEEILHEMERFLQI